MSESDQPPPRAIVAGPINREPPPKRDIVERALSDGMTDPARIAEWARNYQVELTIDEIQSLMRDIKS